MRSATGGSRLAVVAVVTLLIAALVAPGLVALLVWSQEESRDGTARTDAPVYALETSARAVTISATATPQWGAPVVVRAPAWSGTVTQVLVQPGTVAQQGMPVARVDGIEVRYVVLDSPLYRPVCEGDAALVAEVRAVLSAAGLSPGSGPRLTPVDVSSIRRYAASIGVPGAREVTCFEPGWVLVGSAEVGVVASVDLAVGAQVPAPGEPVLTGAASLAGLSLRGDSGAPSIDERLTTEGADLFADTELIIGGRRTGVGVAELADPAALAGLADLLDPEAESTTVAVMLTLSDSQFAVPATAVIDPLGEQPCVLPATARAPSVPVSVVASSVSGVVIDVGSWSPAEPIRVAPGEAACAS